MLSDIYELNVVLSRHMFACGQVSVKPGFQLFQLIHVGFCAQLKHLGFVKFTVVYFDMTVGKGSIRTIFNQLDFPSRSK